MDMSHQFKSRFFNVDDITEPTVYTVGSVIMEQLQGEHKPVMYFRGAGDKGFVLTPPNGKKMIELFGKESNDWVGKEIVLYPAIMEFRGKEQPCTRIRAYAGDTDKAKSAKPAEIARYKSTREEMDDEVPF